MSQDEDLISSSAQWFQTLVSKEIARQLGSCTVSLNGVLTITAPGMEPAPTVMSGGGTATHARPGRPKGSGKPVGKPASKSTGKGSGTLTPAGREAIRAAQLARWAKIKRARAQAAKAAGIPKVVKTTKPATKPTAKLTVKAAVKPTAVKKAKAPKKAKAKTKATPVPIVPTAA